VRGLFQAHQQTVQVLPVLLVMGLTWLLAWHLNGSVAARDWLPYAFFAALLLAVILASGRSLQPSRAALAAFLGLTCLAGWTAVSLAWSPLPDEARNDALLVVLYALVFLTGVVLAHGQQTKGMLAAVVLGLGSLAVATELVMVFSRHPVALYAAGRLFFPVGYWNAQAALFLIGFWPAISVAASRAFGVFARALSCGLAASLLAGVMLVQSKGGVIALAVSIAVVLIVSRERLRFLFVLLITVVPVSLLYLPLTRPFRLDTPGKSHSALADGIRSAGVTALLVSCGVAVLAFLYASVDCRVRVGRRMRRLFGGAAVVCVLVALIVGIVRVGHPVGFVQSKWNAFKHMPQSESGSSHLFTLGSNRYDFWRVAADEFVDHPIGGIGQHGFAAAYLQKGHSNETPQRSHSIVLDVLSETGIVGFVCFLIGVGLPLLVVARRARTSLLHAGIFGAGVYWLVHSSGDWVWTFPAVGIPTFLLLGLGVSGGASRYLSKRWSLFAATVVTVIGCVAFVPPWLSSRLAAEAESARPAQASRDLRWARWLDPLSPTPFVVQAQLASKRSQAVNALSHAARLEPRSVTYQYLLGWEQLKAGRARAAVRTLLIAQRLYPRDDVIQRALTQARRAARKQGHTLE
jgi:hypothetical protein